MMNSVPVTGSSPEDGEARERSTPTATAQKAEMEAHLPSSEVLLFYPERTVRGALELRTQDVERLLPGVCLNDTLIEFGCKYIVQEVADEELCRSTHVYSPHFYTSLVGGLGASACTTPELSKAALRHARVSRWTRLVDVFENDYVVVPINVKSHWLLVIICFAGHALPHEQACHGSSGSYILLFDSLRGHVGNLEEIASHMRDYLTEEWKTKRESELTFTKLNMPLYVPLTPQQTNNTDCGVYVLLNLETFFRAAPKLGEPVQMNRRLFTIEDAVLKRAAIREIIMELHEKQRSGSDSSKC